MLRDYFAMPGIVKSMGLVFGDIGTSPIYTFTAIFLMIPPTPQNIMGMLSLIIWTLTILVTVEYTFLAMHLGKKGEGGTIVLKEILLPLLKSGNQVAFISLLAIVGISLFIGDGVITPVISILSAVEGILLIPGFENTAQVILMLIAAVIAIGLFAIQARGSERVAWAFGPVMVIWFAVLAVSGLFSLFICTTGNLRGEPHVWYQLPDLAWHRRVFDPLVRYPLCNGRRGAVCRYGAPGQGTDYPCTGTWFLLRLRLIISGRVRFSSHIPVPIIFSLR